MLLNVLFSYCPQSTININGSIIKSSNSQKLLGVTIDSNFTFQEHINNLYRKPSQNYMRCPEYHIIYHQIRSVSCSKSL